MPGSDFLADQETLDALSDAECRVLLAESTFGRVGVTSGGLPVIFPVRYAYSDSTITFRTGRGTKLRAAQSGDVLAFEVDTYDPATGEGWSVLVLGRAVVVPDGPDDGATERGGAESEMLREHSVELHCELITGRRLVPVHADN